MDRLLKKNWFVVLISFILSLMLYTIVAVPKNIQQGAGPGGQQDGQERVEHVAVNVYYDETKYVVSGVPETVTVTLTGTSLQLLMARMEKNLEVYADLEQLGVGTHNVRLQHRGISENIGVTIDPTVITVTIEKRVNEDFPITIEYTNEDQLPEGHTVGQPIVSPSTVTISGSEAQLSRIAAVKGYIDLEGEKSSFTKSVPIAIYDENDNELLGFSLHPNVVDVEVPIVGPHKFVPIKINQVNELPEGLSIESITTKPEIVAIFSDDNSVENIEYVEATLDLEKISDKNPTTLTIDITLPKGIKRVEPEQIEVVVDIGKEESRTLKNIPLQVNGLRDGLSLSFIDPKSGKMDVVISGAKKVIERMTLKDVNAFVDVSNLGKGRHSVAIKFNGPQNIVWQNKKATFEIH